MTWVCMPGQRQCAGKAAARRAATVLLYAATAYQQPTAGWPHTRLPVCQAATAHRARRQGQAVQLCPLGVKNAKLRRAAVDAAATGARQPEGHPLLSGGRRRAAGVICDLAEAEYARQGRDCGLHARCLRQCKGSGAARVTHAQPSRPKVLKAAERWAASKEPVKWAARVEVRVKPWLDVSPAIPAA